MFQFTHPGRGATISVTQRDTEPTVSIHAPREGCDRDLPKSPTSTPSFNSRTPGGVRQKIHRHPDKAKEFQFTHPGRGATALAQQIEAERKKFQFTHPGRGATIMHTTLCSSSAVSIHAPREGCDLKQGSFLVEAKEVSIHAPREGCDKCWQASLERRSRFQFTHPGRGATPPLPYPSLGTPGFNSRTPGGVRQKIHRHPDKAKEFQFTHPGRGATSRDDDSRSRASRFNSRTPGGVRLRVEVADIEEFGFNSRTPGGVRRLRRPAQLHLRRFNSRTPGGVRPNRGARTRLPPGVSIHAPREGCDFEGCEACHRTACFNSRTPGGVRPRVVGGANR